MFTGIIEAIGQLRSRQDKGGDCRIEIASRALDLSDTKPGDSIAVNGVCLTVTECLTDGFCADVSRETLSHTTIGHLRTGSLLNLEKALLATSRLGGHLVSGHVDAVGEVLSRKDNARAVEFRIRAPRELAKYIAHKGSITVDGTSLTVNAVSGAEFALTLIPHTIALTISQHYQAGTKVNLEVDLLARYLERLLQGEKPASGTITEHFLGKHGYL